MFGFFKKRKNNTATVQASQPITNTINVIDSAVLNHLKMKTNGALMITGDWGSGKTYYLKTKLFEKIKAETEFKPIVISVYGAKDKESIAQKLVFNYWDTYTESIISTQKITQALTKLASAIPAIAKYVNVEKILTANGENLLKMLPHDELVICFDDVERISDKLDINDFLGLVNELVENSRAKVILIANAKKFRKKGEDTAENKKLIYLEKTVEKTVHYLPDLDAVLTNILSEYKPGAFVDFFNHNKTWVLDSLNVIDNGDETLKNLKIELVNIRTIKFAIEHFRLVFEAVANTKKSDEDLVQQQLKSAWLFVIGVSVVFRSGDDISFDNTNHLEEPEPTLADLDIDLSRVQVLMGQQGVEEEPVDDPHTFAKRFKIIFYDRLSQPYRFYNEIFRLITGGQAIDANILNADFDEQFDSKEGKVNPAQALVDQFVTGGWWNFSDAEFKPKLEQLLAYSKAGEFNNPVSYLNATVFLFGFKDLIGKTEDEIVADTKTGLDKYFNRIDFNYYLESQFTMSEGHFQSVHARQVVDHMKAGFKALEKKTEQESAAALEKLFINDLRAFVKEIIHPSSRTTTPYHPVFNFFNSDSITEGLNVWEPSGIMDLASFMEIRYKPNSFVDRLTDELPFLKKLREEVSKFDDANKPLSKHLIYKELMPKTDAAIEQLERFI